jgi:hypothetical protein
MYTVTCRAGLDQKHRKGKGLDGAVESDIGSAVLIGGERHTVPTSGAAVCLGKDAPAFDHQKLSSRFF